MVHWTEASRRKGPSPLMHGRHCLFSLVRKSNQGGFCVDVSAIYIYSAFSFAWHEWMSVLTCFEGVKNASTAREAQCIFRRWVYSFGSTAVRTWNINVKNKVQTMYIIAAHNKHKRELTALGWQWRHMYNQGDTTTESWVAFRLPPFLH